MNALSLSFLFFASMPLIVLIVVVIRQRLELRAKRRRLRDIAAHGVRIECPSNRPALDLSRLKSGGVLLDTLACLACSWIILAALWLLACGAFAL